MANQQQVNNLNTNGSVGKQFLNVYQSLQFNRETDPHKSVVTSRKKLFIFSQELAKSVCVETQLKWMDVQLRKINSEVDRYDSEDCINNDTDSITRLVKDSKKDTGAHHWKSSLSLMDESFNDLLSSTGVCQNPNVEEKSDAVKSLVQVLSANYDNVKNEPPSPPSTLSCSYKKMEKTSTVAESKTKRITFDTKEIFSNRAKPPADCRNEPDSSKINSRPYFFNFTKDSNIRSMDINMEERFSNQSANFVGNKFPPFSKNHESSFETNQCNGRSKNCKSSSASNRSNNSFRTASEELKIQNVNKYGNSNGPYNTESNRSGYGNYQKKSLGGLGVHSRSVTSKFRPPVPSEDVRDFEDMQVDSSNCSVRNDLLKCIDPKMIELIENEIMDQGSPTTWDDIAGLEFAKKTIQEIVVLPFLRPDLFTGLRSPPKGILLFGPPGTGKTLIGKCIASESESTFFSISASSLTSKWIGEGEKMVRALFAVARSRQPSVIFIDEIDSLLSQRSDSEHESSRRMKTEFLVQLDGATTGDDDRILIIGATNRPQELDEAARRRLIKRLYIPLPDKSARIQIVTRHMAKIRNDLTEEQIDRISDLTDGYSGADMECACKEAALEPLRYLDISKIKHISVDEVKPIVIDDFMTALSRVKSSVSPKDLDQYSEWDKMFGSGGTAK